MGVATLQVKARLPLSFSHYDELKIGSGLNDATIRAMGVYTETDSRKVHALLNWNSTSENRTANWYRGDYAMHSPGAAELTDCLVFPYFDADRLPIGVSRLRPDNPRIDKRNGRKIKYESAVGQAAHLYFLPGSASWLNDPTIPLGVGEGEKKAACGQQHLGIPFVGIAGVWAWKEKGKGLLPDFDQIAFNGRLVYLFPDSDYSINLHIQRAMYALADTLRERGAVVRIVCIPHRGDAKTGLDDWIVAQGADELRELLPSAPKARTNFSVYIEEPPSPVISSPPLPLTEKLVRFSFDTGIPCERIHRRLLEHIEQKHDAALGFTCKRWGCKGCCPRLQQRWNDHSVGLMEDLQEQGQAAYVFHGQSKDWNRVRQLLKKRGGNFIRVARVGLKTKYVGGLCFSFTRIDALTVVTDKPFKGATQADAAQAAVVLTNAIQAFRPDNSAPRIPDGSCQRISTSREWKLQRDDKRTYTDQGPVYRGQKELIAEAERLGVYAEEWDEPEEGIADGTDLHYPACGVGEIKEQMRDEIAGRKPNWRERRKSANTDKADAIKPPLRKTAVAGIKTRHRLGVPELGRGRMAANAPRLG